VKEEVIGRRYAKALIQIGKEKGTWEQIGNSLESVLNLFQTDRLLNRVLCDPVHERAKRKAILKEILQRLGVDPVSMNFLLLLVDKERIRYLPVIFGIYRKLEDGLAGRLRAKIVTAQRIEEDQRSAIQRMMEGRFNKRVILEETEDPEILGGVICKVDGMVFDGSVRTQLEILKTRIRGE
jgi:F-type H+-transporting ATPase subunit delta